MTGETPGVDRAQRRGLFTVKSPDRNMIDKTYQPSAVEGRIYATWEEAGAFDSGRPERKNADPYCIVIPPPNVTGSLHMGHALNNTLQDILARFERIRRHHHPPIEAARRVVRLAARALHYGRGAFGRRAESVRRSLSRGTDLQ